MFDRELYGKRIDWFRKARFGMFIHWGIYAIPGRGEWVKSIERIPDEAYGKYFDEFNPVSYDPVKWAKLAKRAGMKYAVLTAKHHDGFCLFDSKLTEYKSTTCCGRDLVKEFLEAFRHEGIRVGLYYSLLDWHHPDYPKYGDLHHPMRENPAYEKEKIDFSNYLAYLHGQVEELCTRYGKLDILWFDFSYGEMCGEKWEASRLVKMIRKYQPDVIIDNRLEVSGSGFGSIVTNDPSDFCGDFVSPEQIIPPKGIYCEDGSPAVWEACITLNNSWGYVQRDRNFKPADMVIKKLVECVSKGGNLLVNVGPDARGIIPEESEKILKEVGGWMDRNAESIYGCGLCDIEKPDYGRITGKGNKIYYHVMEAQVGYIPLYGVKKEQIKKIRLLSDLTELQIEDIWIVRNYPDMVFVSLGESPLLPDCHDTVIEVELMR